MTIVSGSNATPQHHFWSALVRTRAKPGFFIVIVTLKGLPAERSTSLSESLFGPKSSTMTLNLPSFAGAPPSLVVTVTVAVSPHL